MTALWKKIAKKRVSKFVLFIFFVAVSLSILIPLLWVIGNSLRFNSEIGRTTEFSLSFFIPEKPTFENYHKLFAVYSFTRYILNTVFVAVTVTLTSMLVNSMAAYGFARLRFPGRDIIFTILLITLIVPGEVVLLPQYVLVKRFGWVNSYLALIVPFTAATFGVFYMRQFFLGLPKELEESAIMDGAGQFRIFFQIFLPLSVPPLITLAIMSMIAQWESFIWPLTVLTDKKKYVIQIGINYLFGEHFDEWGSIFAAAVVSFLPILLLFAFLQKYYIEGITSSGIKA